MKKIRVLSGIRASHESLHLGILLGAVEGMKKLQDDPKYETFYMVADLHGITTPFDPEELRRNRMGIAIDYLAAGIDPNKSTLFLQSDVPAHAELAFYISSAVSFDRLRRLPSYKEKVKLYPEDVTAALFNYPVLMAADILLYKAEKVPIGADQVYHLEVTREIAKKLNNTYSLDFPLPRRFNGLDDDKVVIPDLQLPGKKMSKSSPKGAIFVTDSYEKIKEKIAKIPTSTAGGKVFPDQGGVYTLYILSKLFDPKAAEQLKEDYLNGTVKYSKAKEKLSRSIYKFLEPIQKERRRYEENPELVRHILANGAERAARIAGKTLREVKTAMGLENKSQERMSNYGVHFYR